MSIAREDLPDDVGDARRPTWEAGAVFRISADPQRRVLKQNLRWLSRPCRPVRACGQSDGFSGYESAIGAMWRVTHAGCRAHARRKFYDAQKNSPNSEALWRILETIRKLYAVELESEARERELKAREIRKLRQRESAPILHELKRFLDEIAPAIRPQSETGKAIVYTLNQWERLRIFLSDGNVPIDNNGVENKIRTFVIGRPGQATCGLTTLALHRESQRRARERGDLHAH